MVLPIQPEGEMEMLEMEDSKKRNGERRKETGSPRQSPRIKNQRRQSPIRESSTESLRIDNPRKEDTIKSKPKQKLKEEDNLINEKDILKENGLKQSETLNENGLKQSETLNESGLKQSETLKEENPKKRKKFPRSKREYTSKICNMGIGWDGCS